MCYRRHCYCANGDSDKQSCSASQLVRVVNAVGPLTALTFYSVRHLTLVNLASCTRFQLLYASHNTVNVRLVALVAQFEEHLVTLKPVL